MAVQIENATIYLDKQLLVNIRDWTLDDGVLYGLTGETGSGKSTLARWIATIEPAYWKVKYDAFSFEKGKNKKESGFATDLNNGVLSKPLYLLQDAYQIFNPFVSLFVHFKDIWKNNSSRTFLKNFDQVYRILSELGIANPEIMLRRKVHQISQGEAQRAALVLGLIRPSSLIILDEITSNVDFDASKKMLDFVRRWCRTHNIPGLIISHDVPLIREYVEIVYQIMDQQLLELPVSPNNKILRHPKPKTSPLLEGSSIDVFIPNRPPSSSNLLVQLEHFLIGTGESVGISGRSGIGKTTFLKSLLGETEMRWKTLHIQGEPVVADDRKELEALDIRYLPQSVASSFNPAYPLRTSIREIKKIHKVSNPDLNRLYELFKIDPALADRYPGELSGGEIQRMGLISVLMGQPDLILLDESFSSVDAATRQSIWSVLLTEQSKMSFSMVVVSHDQGWLDDHMDRWYKFGTGVY